MVTPPSLFCDTCGTANQPHASYCRACRRPLPSAQPDPHNAATGHQLANVVLKQRYRIIALIGKGGMGAVYKAEDLQLGNRLVALKVMSQRDLTAQEVQAAADAFKREAILLASLQHPNLPSIFDHFEENGRWYLVMSFIQGETLSAYLRHTRDGKLPLAEALQIGIQLCTVLDYLHSQSPPIIFRDLKPSNIMRTASGHIYLIDFGIARHFKQGQAKDTAAYGSMGYAPPEQYGTAQTKPRSDIYSLGTTLFQLVTGHDPASSPFCFPPLQSLVPTAPPELATLLTQLLELEEDKRPANIHLIQQQLQAIASSSAAEVSPHNPQPPVAPTLIAAVPASPSVTSLPPTQYVAFPASMQGTSATTAQTAAQPLQVWEFRSKQLVTIIICAICYAAVAYGLLSAYVVSNDAANITLSQLLFGFIWVLPIFFGLAFGPWVAIGATGIGIFFATLTVSGPFGAAIDWWSAIAITLSGFFAGCMLFKTNRQYQTFGKIVFATCIGVIDICIAVALILLMDSINSQPVTVSLYLIAQIIPCIILLPLLLFIYNLVTRKRQAQAF